MPAIRSATPTRFAIYSFSGSLPWAFGLLAAGWALGPRWKSLLGQFTFVGALAGIIILGLGVAWYLRRRREIASRQDR